MTAGRTMQSEYMPWAKTRSHGKYNLATSGVVACSARDLPFSLADIELSGPSFYGYEPLQNALAKKSGVLPECVVAANGTSMANHLAMAAIIQPGEEVLIETPTYELLVSCARYLGAEVKTFPRRFEEDFRLDPAEVKQAVSDRTRLIVITNLHNPTSSFTEESVLREVGAVSAGVGAKVLVDEVYLDAAFDSSPRSAFHLGEEFVVTNSLTKVYGLSGLRCGWILARPGLAERIWKINDLFGVIPAHPAERLSVIALANLDALKKRSKTLIEQNRVLLNRFLQSRSDLAAASPQVGTVVFPKLLTGSVDSLCELLRQKYETSVVPGRFFGLEQHFRLGIGCDTAMLAEGLHRLGQALDEMSQSPTA